MKGKKAKCEGLSLQKWRVFQQRLELTNKLIKQYHQLNSVLFFFSRKFQKDLEMANLADAGLAHGDSLSRFIRIIRIICCTCWDLHLYRKIMVTFTEEDIYFLSQKKKEILWVGSCALRSRSTASHGGHISPKIEVKE